MENKITNEIEYNHSEFREDLTIDNTPIKIEIRGEVWKDPIHKANESRGDVHTRIWVVQHYNGLEFESGYEDYEGKLDSDKLKARVEYLAKNPFERMYEQYAEKYDIVKQAKQN